MEGIPGAPDSGSNTLIARAKAIITKPAETWPEIAAEKSSPGEIITRYAIPLSAIGPVASFIGGQVFGISAIIATFRPSLMTGITTAVITFVMGLVSLIVFSLIADFLAPKFNGESNRTNAFKLVAYSMTPSWVAGVLGLIPALGLLVFLAGIYGLYVLFLGVRPLMKVPEDKAVAYTAVTIVCGIIAMWVTTAVGASIAALFGGGMMAGGMMSSSDDEVEVSIPGVGKIDTSKIEQASKQMEQAANGEVKPVDTEKLKALLPASLGAYSRTAVDTGAMGNLGKGVSATYTSGDKTITLKVLDSSGLGALAGLAGAMGAEQSHEDVNGYERTSTVDGQMQTEKWNNKDGRGEFGRQVGTRFFVSADGEAASIDELKAAVNAIDQGTLAALAQ